MLFLDRVFSFSTTRNKAHALENTISNTTPINPLALSFPLSSAEYFSSFQVTCITLLENPNKQQIGVQVKYLVLSISTDSHASSKSHYLLNN